MAPRLGEPLALLLLVGLPALLVLGRRRRRALGPRRGALLLAVRGLVLAACVLALADPRWPVPDQHLDVAFVVDGSRSVPSDQQAAAADWLGQALAAAQPDDRTAVVAFGQSPPRLVPTGRAPRVAAREATDLAAALRLAGEIAPNVVLVSDGWETVGHAQDEVARLQARGVHVSYWPLRAPTVGPEVALQRLEAPPYVRVGEPAEVRLTLASTLDTSTRVTLSVDDQPALVQDAPLAPGPNTLTLRYTADAVGPHVLSANAVPSQDTLLDNNRLDALVVARPPARVLLIEQSPGEADRLAASLTAARLEVERRLPEGVPVRPAELAGYDAVGLVDVQATRLSLDQQQTLLTYVRDDGHGLLVFGGSRGFGLGGYADTALEQALPVRAAPPDRNAQGDLALLLVIDSSGSMALASNHVSKIGMAREAAIRATDIMKPTDTIGVLGFTTRQDWVVPLQRVGDNGGLPELQARIAGIQAAGGTDVYAALQAAFDAMAPVNARFRHVLLLTDGHSPNPDYASLVQANQALGITLSTIGIGGDADSALLAQLAQIGQGRSYVSQRFEDIPSIVTRETTIATRSALAEGAFQPSPADPSPLLPDLETGTLPTLTGYVQTAPRSGTTQALISGRGDPILAHWHYGLGRVVAWTSDAGDRWAADWLGWSGAPAFFASMTRWTMTEPVDIHLRASVRVDGQQVTFEAHSVDDGGAFADGLDTRATVVTPDGRALELRLPQVAPGRYQQQVRVELPGLYRVVVRQAAREEVTGFLLDGAQETRALGTNLALLDSLAAQTGGRRLEAPGDVFSARAPSNAPPRELPIWPWLLAGALSLWPVDVALRRLRLSPLRMPRGGRSAAR
jgi:Ca-activated chloride channel homolog